MNRILEWAGPRSGAIAVYPLMDSPKRTLIFSACYLSFVKVIGPRWMRNRKPYQLRLPMLIYNSLLVVLSAWIFLSIGFHGWFTTFRWRCEPVDLSNSPSTVKVVFICWVFYVSKLVEYMDTIFFVLRKKDSQINFLHLFHHTTVPVTTWFGVSYGPGGSNTIFVLLNTFVHTWMYLYYALSAMGPEIQKYLWWKKYLTSLQLAQFFLVFAYFLQLYLFPPKDCRLSDFLMMLSAVQAFIYLGLFLNFYFRTYKNTSVAISSPKTVQIANISGQHNSKKVI